MTVSMNKFDVSKEGMLAADQLAALLSEARQSAGYSIDDLAETTGLVSDEIVSVESGADVDPAKVKRIAAALRVPVSSLAVS